VRRLSRALRPVAALSALNCKTSHFMWLPLPQVTLSDVRAAWSGIRPLIKDPAKLASGSTTAQLSRKVCACGAPLGVVIALATHLRSWAALSCNTLRGNPTPRFLVAFMLAPCSATPCPPLSYSALPCLALPHHCCSTWWRSPPQAWCPS